MSSSVKPQPAISVQKQPIHPQTHMSRRYKKKCAMVLPRLCLCSACLILQPSRRVRQSHCRFYCLLIKGPQVVIVPSFAIEEIMHISLFIGAKFGVFLFSQSCICLIHHRLPTYKHMSWSRFAPMAPPLLAAS